MTTGFTFDPLAGEEGSALIRGKPEERMSAQAPFATVCAYANAACSLGVVQSGERR